MTLNVWPIESGQYNENENRRKKKLRTTTTEGEERINISTKEKKYFSVVSKEKQKKCNEWEKETKVKSIDWLIIISKTFRFS